MFVFYFLLFFKNFINLKYHILTNKKYILNNSIRRKIVNTHTHYLHNTILISIDVFCLKTNAFPSWYASELPKNYPLSLRLTAGVACLRFRGAKRVESKRRNATRGSVDPWWANVVVLLHSVQISFVLGQDGGSEEGSGRWDLIVYTKWINPPTLRKITATAGLG